MTDHTYNIDGTVSSDFQIGESGPTLHEGVSTPASSQGTGGDVYVRTGNAPGLHLKTSSLWLPMLHPSLGIVRWDVASGSTFAIPPAITYVGIVAASPGGTTTLYLPAVIDGSRVTIKDEAGTAASHPIVICAPEGIVEANASYTIASNHGAVTLMRVGSSRWIIEASYGG